MDCCIRFKRRIECLNFLIWNFETSNTINQTFPLKMLSSLRTQNSIKFIRSLIEKILIHSMDVLLVHVDFFEQIQLDVLLVLRFDIVHPMPIFLIYDLETKQNFYQFVPEKNFENFCLLEHVITKNTKTIRQHFNSLST